MASSMLVAATSAENAETDDDALSTSLRSCANDPDFATICAFLQKFSSDLGVQLPNFKQLQEWFSNTDEVASQLRDLHIKLLRKTRRTVHEKSWESALSKFCFSYSAQDAWEVERFGYKKSTIKVKLRILRALLESQFERNAKFRTKILTLSADSLRSEPIGRDRLGHTYWSTRDDDCNLRIYQEHLDEEIWQVVATNRDELVNLIARLKGNEVVLPSTDIGIIDEDTSSSNSCAAPIEKPPPPEEKEDDDSQEEEDVRVPNLRIKLNTKGENNGEPQIDNSPPTTNTTKRSFENRDSSSPHRDEQAYKKSRPSLLDSKRTKKPSRYENAKSEDEDDEEEAEEEEEELEGDEEEEDDIDEEVEEESIDSAAAEEDENEAKEFEEDDDDEFVSSAIEAPLVIVRGEGAGKDCQGGNPMLDVGKENQDEHLLMNVSYFSEAEDEVLKLTEVIEESTLYVYGEGSGAACLVGNAKGAVEEGETTSSTEPKATFFFGEPGCLKLSPIKPNTPTTPKTDVNPNNADGEDVEENSQKAGVNLITQFHEAAQHDAEINNVDAKKQNLPLNAPAKGQLLATNGDGSLIDAKETPVVEAVNKSDDEPQHSKHMDYKDEAQTSAQQNHVSATVVEEKFEVVMPNVESEETMNQENSKGSEWKEEQKPDTKLNTADAVDQELPTEKPKSSPAAELLETVEQEKFTEAATDHSKNIATEKTTEVVPEVVENVTKEKSPEAEQVTKENLSIVSPTKANENIPNVEIALKKCQEAVTAVLKNLAKVRMSEEEASNSTKVKKPPEILGKQKSPETAESSNVLEKGLKEKIPEAVVVSKVLENAIKENEEEVPRKLAKITQEKEPEVEVVVKQLKKVSKEKTPEMEAPSRNLRKTTKEKTPEVEVPSKNPRTTMKEKTPDVEVVKPKPSDVGILIKEVRKEQSPKPAIQEKVTKENISEVETRSKRKEQSPEVAAASKVSEMGTRSKVLKKDVAIPTKIHESITQEKSNERTSITKELAVPLKKTKSPEAEASEVVIDKEKSDAEVPSKISEQILKEKDAATETPHGNGAEVKESKVKAALQKKTKATSEKQIVAEVLREKEGAPIHLEPLAEVPEIASTVGIIPSVSTAIIPSKPVVPNRKRRLADFSAPAPPPPVQKQLTSESEFEAPSEPQDDNEDEAAELDVGGKRLKMRPKQTHAEIRKKVEAQKKLDAVEETTSSSGEEDARRRRKIISPKRHLLRKDTTNKTTESQSKTLEVAAVSNDSHKEITENVAIDSSASSKKVSLAHIIEKQLKKVSDPLAPPQMQQITATVEITPKMLAPPKKVPVTKPLKKNLLTQLRQEESDEEAIPRKRTISEPLSAVDTSKEKDEPTVTIEPHLPIVEAPKPIETTAPAAVELPKAMEPPKSVPEGVKLEIRKTPERRMPDRQRKRRSSVEIEKERDDPAELPEKRESSTKEKFMLPKVPEKREPPIKEKDPPTKEKDTLAKVPEKQELLNREEVELVKVPGKRVFPPKKEATVTLRKTPERKTPERQRKRRSSENGKPLEAPSTRSKQEGVSEKLKKKDNEIEKKAEPALKPSVKEDIQPSTVAAPPAPVAPPTPTVAISLPTVESPSEIVTGRRSSRRGGTAVIYAELPQLKRTRAGSKAAPTTSNKKDEEKEQLKEAEDEPAKGKVKLEKQIKTPDKPKDIKKDGVKMEVKEEIEEQEEKEEANETSQLAVKSEVTTKNEKNKIQTATTSKAIADTKKITPKKEINKEDSITTVAVTRSASTDQKASPKLPTEQKVPSKETVADTSPEKKSTEKEIMPDPAEIAIPPKPKEDLTENLKSSPAAVPSSSNSTPRARVMRNKRELDALNIVEAVDSETPVRQSRRIAQQKIREEAERRKLEEIALRTMKQELKKKKKAEKEADPTVVEPSANSSSSEEESEVEKKKRVKKKCPGEDGWSSGSEEEDPEEEEDPPHYYSDPGSPLFKSDHEFSPESDLEDESQVVPVKRARTVRKEDAEGGYESCDEEACQKCGKSDHPEWILLCDKCDKGYHCSCLLPVLFYIPEGDWYCPPCQQSQLIIALEEKLKEFDELVDRKKLEEEEEKRLAEQAELVEKERLEEEQRRKERKKNRKKRGSSGADDYDSESGSSHSEYERDSVGANKSAADGETDDGDNSRATNKPKNDDNNEKGKRRRNDRRIRRRAAARSIRRNRRGRLDSGSNSKSDTDSDSRTDSSSSSSATDSDDEPIYKLRKRRQINVSYRLNEFDDLIESALKKEMSEAAGAGNLGRGKDITTIMEADKEESARQRQLEDGTFVPIDNEAEPTETETVKAETAPNVESDDDILMKSKDKPRSKLKKKPRKLTTLDISSEEDHASDEDFKGSSDDDDEEEDEDSSVSVSTNSDSSLDVYRRRSKGGKRKKRKAARRAARERRKDRRFVVDDSDEDNEVKPSKSKKKRKDDSDYTESETGDDDLSELTENMDSADLCDDTTSDDSDGAWQPSKQRKSNAAATRKSPKIKKPQKKKIRHVEYSDDDISESEEEDEDDDYGGSGKGSGKQPRSQPLKSSGSGKGKSGGKTGQGKGKGKSPASKKKKKQHSDDEDSLSGSEDSTRRTRGRRYAYIEDFDDDSSDGGIKPGVMRPDTPPEEREKFIQRQEEIKRMLAEKNAEGAKLAATPRLTPIKGTGDKDKRSPAKPGDSLSTVPLSVIRQAKVLDIDYLQRKGETVGELDDVDEVDSEFDDADLPDDFPEDMDEDAIARMVEEEEFDSAASRDLPPPDEVLRTTPSKAKPKEPEKPQHTPNPSLAALSQMPGASSASGLQEPLRKRLPMPTMHPPLLRHQFAPHPSMHMLHRPGGPPPSHLLQNALSAPLGQPLERNFPHQHPLSRMQGMPPHGHALPPHLMHSRQPLPASQALPGAVSRPEASGAEGGSKPRGRRKKITPLRDPLQKQQTAASTAAAAALTTTTTASMADKKDGPPPATVISASGGVIKAAAGPLSIAQPPQLYKPGSAIPETQPSVITRIPHLPPHGAPPGRPGGPPGGIYPGADVPRFYGPPQQGLPPGARQSPSSQRMPGLPQAHPGLRPTYGPPPPLRGGVPPNHGQPPTTSAGGGAGRGPYPPPPTNTQNEHHPTPYGPPPPSRHAATAHLNAYRPHIYGNPNFTGRPNAANLRPGMPHGAEYAGGPRGYPPFGYYAAPPPLTTPPATHQQAVPPPPSTHSSAAPSSVIVVAPPAAAAPPPPSNHLARAKSPSPTATPLNSKPKKLTTLEAYPVTVTKSPLGESSGSRSSPSVVQPEGGEDSSSAPTANATAAANTASSEGQASEFSGLVSYFSSQHDDYNT